MNQIPKPISPFRLASVLRHQKDPNLALNLFQNPNPNPSPTPKTPPKPFRYTFLCYDIIVTKLGRAKMFDQLEQVLHQLKQETRFVPREILFCNVINFYGRARLIDRAIMTFHQIPSYNCVRSVKSLNSLLNALLDCKEYEKMREFYLGIDEYGSPDACTFNILINACILNGCLDDAWKVFDEMPKRGVHPNEVTFATLTKGLCLNLRVREAFKLKEDMLRLYGVVPNAFLYTSLIKGLCGIGELSLAFKLKDEMVQKKFKLGSSVYSTLISALFKVKRRGEVCGILEEMRANGCEPDTVTYNAMIDGFCKEKDFEAAFRALDEMKEKGCKPDIVSYNIIIGGLCKEGKWGEAKDLFEDMPRRGCIPDVVSYRILFDNLCDRMQLKEAAVILDAMVFKGYMPRSTSVNKFVYRLCQEQNIELSWTVLNSLTPVNVIDADTWRMLTSATCKKDKLSIQCELIESLVMP